MLDISPPELVFENVWTHKVYKNYLHVHNTFDSDVEFHVKPGSSHRYEVNPSVISLPPGGECDVEVCLRLERPLQPRRIAGGSQVSVGDSARKARDFIHFRSSYFSQRVSVVAVMDPEATEDGIVSRAGSRRSASVEHTRSRDPSLERSRNRNISAERLRRSASDHGLSEHGPIARIPPRPIHAAAPPQPCPVGTSLSRTLAWEGNDPGSRSNVAPVRERPQGLPEGSSLRKPASTRGPRQAPASAGEPASRTWSHGAAQGLPHPSYPSGEQSAAHRQPQHAYEHEARLLDRLQKAEDDNLRLRHEVCRLEAELSGAKSDVSHLRSIEEKLREKIPEADAIVEMVIRKEREEKERQSECVLQILRDKDERIQALVRRQAEANRSILDLEAKLLECRSAVDAAESRSEKANEEKRDLEARLALLEMKGTNPKMQSKEQPSKVRELELQLEAREQEFEETVKTLRADVSRLSNAVIESEQRMEELSAQNYTLSRDLHATNSALAEATAKEKALAGKVEDQKEALEGMATQLHIASSAAAAFKQEAHSDMAAEFKRKHSDLLEENQALKNQIADLDFRVRTREDVFRKHMKRQGERAKEAIARVQAAMSSQHRARREANTVTPGGEDADDPTTLVQLQAAQICELEVKLSEAEATLRLAERDMTRASAEKLLAKDANTRRLQEELDDLRVKYLTALTDLSAFRGPPLKSTTSAQSTPHALSRAVPSKPSTGKASPGSGLASNKKPSPQGGAKSSLPPNSKPSIQGEAKSSQSRSVSPIARASVTSDASVNTGPGIAHAEHPDLSSDDPALAHAHDQVASLQERVRWLESINKKAQSTVENSERKLVETLRRVEEENRHYTAEIATQKSLVEKLNSRLSGAAIREEELSQQVFTLSSSLAETERLCNDLQKRVQDRQSDVKKAFDDSNASPKPAPSLSLGPQPMVLPDSAEAQKLRERAKELEVVAAKLREQKREAEEKLRSTVETHVNERDHLLRELDEMEKRLRCHKVDGETRLRALQDSLRRIGARGGASQEAARLAKEVDSLMSQLSQNRVERDIAVEQSAQLQTQLDQRQEQVVSLEKRLRESPSGSPPDDVRWRDNVILGLSADVARARAESQKLQSVIERTQLDAKRRQDTSKSELARADAGLASAQYTAVLHEERVTELQQELLSAASEIQSLKENVNQKDHELHRWRTQCSEFEDVATKAQCSLRNLQRQLHEVKEESTKRILECSKQHPSCQERTGGDNVRGVRESGEIASKRNVTEEGVSLANETESLRESIRRLEKTHSAEIAALEGKLKKMSSTNDKTSTEAEFARAQVEKLEALVNERTLQISILMDSLQTLQGGGDLEQRLVTLTTQLANEKAVQGLLTARQREGALALDRALSEAEALRESAQQASVRERSIQAQINACQRTEELLRNEITAMKHQLSTNEDTIDTLTRDVTMATEAAERAKDDCKHAEERMNELRSRHFESSKTEHARWSELVRNYKEAMIKWKAKAGAKITHTDLAPISLNFESGMVISLDTDGKLCGPDKHEAQAGISNGRLTSEVSRVHSLVAGLPDDCLDGSVGAETVKIMGETLCLLRALEKNAPDLPPTGAREAVIETLQLGILHSQREAATLALRNKLLQGELLATQEEKNLIEKSLEMRDSQLQDVIRSAQRYLHRLNSQSELHTEHYQTRNDLLRHRVEVLSERLDGALATAIRLDTKAQKLRCEKHDLSCMVKELKARLVEVDAACARRIADVEVTCLEKARALLTPENENFVDFVEHTLKPVFALDPDVESRVASLARHVCALKVVEAGVLSQCAGLIRANDALRKETNKLRGSLRAATSWKDNSYDASATGETSTSMDTTDGSSVTVLQAEVTKQNTKLFHLKSEVLKWKQEAERLSSEADSARALRDELSSLHEREVRSVERSRQEGEANGFKMAASKYEEELSLLRVKVQQLQEVMRSGGDTKQPLRASPRRTTMQNRAEPSLADESHVSTLRKDSLSDARTQLEKERLERESVEKELTQCGKELGAARREADELRKELADRDAEIQLFETSLGVPRQSPQKGYLRHGGGAAKKGDTAAISIVLAREERVRRQLRECESRLRDMAFRESSARQELAKQQTTINELRVLLDHKHSGVSCSGPEAQNTTASGTDSSTVASVSKPARKKRTGASKSEVAAMQALLAAKEAEIGRLRARVTDAMQSIDRSTGPTPDVREMRKQLKRSTDTIKSLQSRLESSLRAERLLKETLERFQGNATMDVFTPADMVNDSAVTERTRWFTVDDGGDGAPDAGVEGSSVGQGNSAADASLQKMHVRLQEEFASLQRVHADAVTKYVRLTEEFTLLQEQYDDTRASLKAYEALEREHTRVQDKESSPDRREAREVFNTAARVVDAALEEARALIGSFGNRTANGASEGTANGGSEGVTEYEGTSPANLEREKPKIRVVKFAQFEAKAKAAERCLSGLQAQLRALEGSIPRLLSSAAVLMYPQQEESNELRPCRDVGVNAAEDDAWEKESQTREVSSLREEVASLRAQLSSMLDVPLRDLDKASGNHEESILGRDGSFGLFGGIGSSTFSRSRASPRAENLSSGGGPHDSTETCASCAERKAQEEREREEIEDLRRREEDVRTALLKVEQELLKRRGDVDVISKQLDEERQENMRLRGEVDRKTLFELQAQARGAKSSLGEAEASLREANLSRSSEESKLQLQQERLRVLELEHALSLLTQERDIWKARAVQSCAMDISPEVRKEGKSASDEEGQAKPKAEEAEGADTTDEGTERERQGEEKGKARSPKKGGKKGKIKLTTAEPPKTEDEASRALETAQEEWRKEKALICAEVRALKMRVEEIDSERENIAFRCTHLDNALTQVRQENNVLKASLAKAEESYSVLEESKDKELEKLRSRAGIFEKKLLQKTGEWREEKGRLESRCQSLEEQCATGRGQLDETIVVMKQEADRARNMASEARARAVAAEEDAMGAKQAQVCSEKRFRHLAEDFGRFKESRSRLVSMLEHQVECLRKRFAASLHHLLGVGEAEEGVREGGEAPSKQGSSPVQAEVLDLIVQLSQRDAAVAGLKDEIRILRSKQDKPFEDVANSLPEGWQELLVKGAAECTRTVDDEGIRTEARVLRADRDRLAVEAKSALENAEEWRRKFEAQAEELQAALKSRKSEQARVRQTLLKVKEKTSDPHTLMQLPQYQELEAEVSRLSEENKNRREENLRKAKLLNALRAERTQQTELVEKHKAATEVAEEKSKRLSKDGLRKDALIRDLKGQLESQQKTIDEIRTSATDADTKPLRESIKSLQQEVHRRDEQIAGLKKRIETSKQQYETMESEMISRAKYNALIRKHKMDLDRKDDHVKELKSKLEVIQKEFESFRSKQNSIAVREARKQEKVLEGAGLELSAAQGRISLIQQALTSAVRGIEERSEGLRALIGMRVHSEGSEKGPGDEASTVRTGHTESAAGLGTSETGSGGEDDPETFLNEAEAFGATRHLSRDELADLLDRSVSRPNKDPPPPRGQRKHATKRKRRAEAAGSVAKGETMSHAMKTISDALHADPVDVNGIRDVLLKVIDERIRLESQYQTVVQGTDSIADRCEVVALREAVLEYEKQAKDIARRLQVEQDERQAITSRYENMITDLQNRLRETHRSTTTSEVGDHGGSPTHSTSGLPYSHPSVQAHSSPVVPPLAIPGGSDVVRKSEIDSGNAVGPRSSAREETSPQTFSGSLGLKSDPTALIAKSYPSTSLAPEDPTSGRSSHPVSSDHSRPHGTSTPTSSSLLSSLPSGMDYSDDLRPL
eukprot:Rmarinus@m.12427